jgi:hypothetical protein
VFTKIFAYNITATKKLKNKIKYYYLLNNPKYKKSSCKS